MRREYMNKFFVILLLAGVVASEINESYERRYNYFDDYLNSLDEEQQAKLTEEAEETNGSGDGDSFFDEQHLPLRSGFIMSKDVTCCSLGHLAGDKGYHCVSKFYTARLLIRNQNRAHNRKLGFHGRYGSPYYGTKLMKTFEQCMTTRGKVFGKCCHHAANLRRSRPHFDSQQRSMYESKMRRIRLPRTLFQEAAS